MTGEPHAYPTWSRLGRRYLPAECDCLALQRSYLRLVGQGTLVEESTELPSRNVNRAVNGKPPRGQRVGTSTPVGL